MTDPEPDGVDFQQLEALFHQALDLPQAERASLLEEACRGDEAMRRELQRLLEGHSVDDDFLVAPTTDGSDSLEERLDPDLSGREVGGFRLRRVLARGGMGTVYEAEQQSPRRTVALKLLRPGLLSPSAVRRFEYESEILARLRHPGVAQIFESGTHSEGALTLPWFAMELIEGASSITAFAAGLNMRERLELFARVCEAVQHGHTQGVIHRDLKPANILVDPDGHPKVIDFGIARVTDAHGGAMLRTTGTHMVGTLAYMSPEQCAGGSGDIDTRSDVYALGVILYEMLCERAPYEVDGKSITEAVRVIQEHVPQRPSALQPRLGADLDAIVLTALEKERERRYPSAAELAADVRRFLDDEPIVARPPSVSYQMRRFARRHKGLVAALVLVFAALATSTWVSWQFAVEAQARATDAENERDNTQDMLAFLETLLQRANPLVAADQTVRELVNHAATLVDTEFADQPHVEAQLRHTFGSAYKNMARHEEAQEQLSRAVELMRGEKPPRPLLVDALMLLGLVQAELGSADKAAQNVEDALALQRTLRGDEHPDSVLALGALAALARRDGRLDDAEALHRRAVEIRRRAGLADDVVLAQCLSNLATAVYKLGRDAEAGELWRESLGIFRRAGDPDSPFLATVLSNLALVVQAQGNFDEALDMYAETARIQERRLDPGHPDVANTLDKIGMCGLEAGKAKEAIPTFERALKIRRERQGEKHRRTAQTRAFLGYALLTDGQLAEALRELSTALEIQRRLLPAGHPSLSGTLLLLGLVHARDGRAEEGMARLEEAQRIRTAVYGAAHYRTANIRSAIGECLVAMGKHADAEAMLLESYSVIQGALGAGHMESRNARQRLVELYRALGQPEKAKTWEQGGPAEPGDGSGRGS